MDWDEIERNWKQAQQKIKQKWVKLTDTDFNAIKAQRDRLEDRIHMRYGLPPNPVRVSRSGYADMASSDSRSVKPLRPWSFGLQISD